MPAKFNRPHLNIVPGVIAGLTPPDQQIVIDEIPGGNARRLTLNFRKRQPSLTIVKSYDTGLIEATVNTPLAAGRQPNPKLLLKRNNFASRIDYVSIYDLADIAVNAIREEAGKAASTPARYRKNLNRPIPHLYPEEKITDRTGKQAAKTAGHEARAWLDTARLRRLNDQICDFMGIDLCRLAHYCYSKFATTDSLNIITAAGADNIRELAKQNPKMTLLGTATLRKPPAQPVTPDALLHLGRGEFHRAAYLAGLPALEPDQIMPLIDPSILSASGYATHKLATMIQLAAAVAAPVPNEIMKEWIQQNGLNQGYYNLSAGREFRLACFRAASMRNRPGPLYVNSRRLREALQGLLLQPAGPDQDPARAADWLERRLQQMQRTNAERSEQIAENLELREARKQNGPPVRPLHSRTNLDPPVPPRPADDVRGRIAELWQDAPAHEQAMQAAAAGSVHITANTVTVTAGATGLPLYTVQRNPSGCLEFHPRPGSDLVIDTQGRIRQGDGTGLPALNAASLAAALSLAPDLPQDPDSPALVQAATAIRYLSSGQQDQARLDRLDARTAAAATEAVNRMIDPQALERAFLASGHPDRVINIDQYNAAKLAGPSLERLTETNPGAAAWIILACPRKVTSSINHPGQLVNIVKKDTGWSKKSEGGTRRHPWKTLAATRPATLRRIVHTPENRETLELDRTMALTAAEAATAAGRRELTASMADVCDLLSDHGGLTPATDAVLLEYCFKDPKAALALGDGLIEIRDYCRANNPTATTFNGLLKAAQKWHRSLQETQRREGMDRRPFKTWESAIAKITLSNGITATALTDTMMLGLESREMRHCVFQYDDYCAKGSARIFHLSSGATAQLSLQKSGWRATQIRRSHNHPPLAEENEAAAELAEKYNEAADRLKREAAQKRRKP